MTWVPKRDPVVFPGKVQNYLKDPFRSQKRYQKRPFLLKKVTFKGPKRTQFVVILVFHSGAKIVSLSINLSQNFIYSSETFRINAHGVLLGRFHGVISLELT